MKCPLCGEDKELLEHHVSYSDRPEHSYHPEAYSVDIVINICGSCHWKIHKETGYYGYLDPPPSGKSGEAGEVDEVQNLTLIDCLLGTSFYESEKYKLKRLKNSDKLLACEFKEGEDKWTIEPYDKNNIEEKNKLKYPMQDRLQALAINEYLELDWYTLKDSEDSDSIWYQ